MDNTTPQTSSLKLTPHSSQLFPSSWRGARGLAEDVRYYGAWMREQARQRIGHLYPPVEITAAMAADRPDLAPYVGQKLTVIAWLWARTVKSPNPAFRHVEVPLASTFILSSKAGKEAYVAPVIEGDSYRFTVKVGTPPAEAKAGTSAGKRAGFRCLLSDIPINYDYIRGEGKAGRLGTRLMAIVAEGDRKRLYIEPVAEHVIAAESAEPTWKPDCSMPLKHRNFQPPVYGMYNLGDIFTSRQLVALTSFSDLVTEAVEIIRRDALAAGMADDETGLDAGGNGAQAYGDAVGTYLALAISRFSDRNNALCTWDSGPAGTRASTGGSARTASLRNLFSRQAIPMAWDFGEANPFSESGGGFISAFGWVQPAVRNLEGKSAGHSIIADAQKQVISTWKIISTDHPYYDNIGYADLSDFFYVWLRRALKPIFPQLFATLAVPKAEELIATPYRHGNKEKAEAFFLDGMTQAMHCLATQAHPSAPVTIYYAFKQSETKSDTGTLSTGWETFLEAWKRYQ
jgi:putative DNA methylase